MAQTMFDGAFKRAFAKEMRGAEIEHEYRKLRAAYFFYGDHPHEAELRAQAIRIVTIRRGIVGSPVSDTR